MRKPCGPVPNAEGKPYEGECACGCDANAGCNMRNCPHSEDCRTVAGVDDYRDDEFVWVREDLLMGSQRDPRPAQIVKSAWCSFSGRGYLHRYEIRYMDARGGTVGAVHVGQLRRMSPLEALSWQA